MTAGVGAATATAPPAEAAAKVSISLSTTKVIAGERVTVTGRLATHLARPVELQQKAHGQWLAVAKGTTSSAGRYTLVYPVTSATEVRVAAPSTRIKGRKYGAVKSKTRKIAVVSQTVSLALPQSVYRNQSVKVSVSAKPTRKGRVLTLEVRSGDDWITVASGAEDGSGVASWTLAAANVGDFSYRVRAAASGGAGEVASKAVAVAVKADPVEASDAARPLTTAEASAIESYTPSSGTLTFEQGAPASVTNLKVGQIVPIPPAPGSTSGALQQITGVSTRNGQTTVKTIGVALPDAVENVPDQASSFALTTEASEFTPEPGVTVTQQPKSPKTSKAYRTSGLSETSLGALELQLDLTRRSGNTFASITGSMSVAPAIDLELDTDWGKLKHYKLGGGVAFDDDVKVKAGLTGDTSLGKLKLGTLRHEAVAFIGPVPVWVELDAPLFVEVTASGSVALTVGYSESGRAVAGVQNKPGSLAPEIYATAPTTSSAISGVEVEGKLSVFGGAEPQLLLYSTGGAYAKIGYQGEVSVSAGPAGPSCTLRFGPYREFGLKTADWLDKLTGNPQKLSASVSVGWRSTNLCPGPASPTIKETTLPDAALGQAYATTLHTADARPATWTLVDGALPSGLSVDSSGTISGTPTGEGISSFTVQATDGNGLSATAKLTLAVTTSVPPGSVGSTSSLPDDASLSQVFGSARSDYLAVYTSGGTSWLAWGTSRPPSALTIATSVYGVTFGDDGTAYIAIGALNSHEGGELLALPAHGANARRIHSFGAAADGDMRIPWTLVAGSDNIYVEALSPHAWGSCDVMLFKLDLNGATSRTATGVTDCGGQSWHINGNHLATVDIQWGSMYVKYFDSATLELTSTSPADTDLHAPPVYTGDDTSLLVQKDASCGAGAVERFTPSNATWSHSFPDLLSIDSTDACTAHDLTGGPADSVFAAASDADGLHLLNISADGASTRTRVTSADVHTASLATAADGSGFIAYQTDKDCVDDQGNHRTCSAVTVSEVLGGALRARGQWGGSPTNSVELLTGIKAGSQAGVTFALRTTDLVAGEPGRDSLVPIVGT